MTLRKAVGGEREQYSRWGDCVEIGRESGPELIAASV